MRALLAIAEMGNDVEVGVYRARQKNGSQVARIFQARPGSSGKQQQEQNSRNLGTVFLPGPVVKEEARGEFKYEANY